jgi:2-polyprenyl-6-methoxyphenol hydroxylase-like FAD-dependent oxidoreductase
MTGRAPIVVGAGPVGLFLALALVRRGLTPLVLEPRTGLRHGSRSIGVHPPSLELLDELGLVDAFLERGVHVRGGLAMTPAGPIGNLRFDDCPGPYTFVLTIPQRETERVLREELERVAPGCIIGAELVGASQDDDKVVVFARSTDGGDIVLESPVVVGCDGKYSATRRALGVPFSGGPYPGHYVMADFPDITQFGADAAIYLSDDGLVESFPLPGGQRRWVARVQGEGTIAELVAAVRRRTGYLLDPAGAAYASSFTAEHYLAKDLSRGRVALAGDAAHIVSPIGGQGMNLGWLGARSLAETIAQTAPGEMPAALARDAQRRKRAARAATRRAELNMWLGRPGVAAPLRERIVRAMLASPWSSVAARAFTMRHLAFGV